MQSFAYDANIDGIYYNFYDTKGTAEVTYLYSVDSRNKDAYVGDVVIPSTVKWNDKIYKVTSIGSYAFWWCSSLSSITIPEGVTSISNSAFSWCM